MPAFGAPSAVLSPFSPPESLSIHPSPLPKPSSPQRRRSTHHPHPHPDTPSKERCPGVQGHITTPSPVPRLTPTRLTFLLLIPANMNVNFDSSGGDGLIDLSSFDQRDRFSYASQIPSSQNSPQSVANMPAQRIWPIPLDMASNVAASSPPEDQQAHSPSHSSSPLSQHSHHSPYQQPVNSLTDWALQQHQHQQQQQPHMPTQDFSQFVSDAYMPVTYNPYAPGFQTSPIDFLPATTQALQAANFQLATAFNTMPPMDETVPAMNWNMGMESWHDIQAAASALQIEGLSHSIGSNSPTGTFLEVLSLPSSSGEGWSMVVEQGSGTGFDHFQQPQPNAAIFNPSQTLHLRTNSDSSDGANSFELGSYEEIAPFPISPFSPESDGYVDAGSHRNCFGDNHNHNHVHNHDTVSPAAAVAPMPIKSTTPTRPTPASGSGATSPPIVSVRRNSGQRRSPVTGKATKAVIRRTSTGKKDGTEVKKVGRRKGPLLPEQRKQASEIRKLRACLRCKFLKKTCDKGEPCAGCQPSHARLWQVPCTRIDIKDIGYFMKDWKADYERHLGRGVSVYNVKGFAQNETIMWITHGYGFALPVYVREVYVADESCFQADWVESCLTDQEPIDFELRTGNLDVGAKGVSVEALSDYLDKHIDGGFEDFIEDHFEGTPFITEILKTAHRYYVKERMPVIRKALKLVLAYNLTLHITLVENQGEEVSLDGQIDDEDSKYYGRTVAPVMINFQIKCAMADMWRELQKEILEELSALYSSVYSGERLKNWPTIFMLASILLAVWEEMQFDCHYRVPDPAAVNKFCSDMETTPVGVIVGLFHAISQKLPAFMDWDTSKHGHLLNNNVAVCEAMTEVREHVIKHESYLRTRPDATFDRNDFDCLSNKFLSKLVIRAN
nr:C6 finger domain-containing protein [Colletotrichum truncatum]KAF6797850.1 C6 finger domain-containing protein [Colletotrichum truncatum]